MDAYIASLEPDMHSTTTWMRTRAPLVDARTKLQSLGEILGNRLELLAWVAPGEEGDGLREEVRRLYGTVGGWVEGMEKMG